MRKTEQMEINVLCAEEWKKFKADFEVLCTNIGRLRTCSACVFETSHYYALKSYDTIIAIINKDTDILFDVLRMVYGYTSTSAQHIAKFKKDYGDEMWGCHIEYRYYNI